MDNWDTNTFRFRIDPEDPNTTDTPKPVEGIGIAETPITSTAPQETVHHHGQVLRPRVHLYRFYTGYGYEKADDGSKPRQPHTNLN